MKFHIRFLLPLLLISLVAGCDKQSSKAAFTKPIPAITVINSSQSKPTKNISFNNWEICAQNINSITVKLTQFVDGKIVNESSTESSWPAPCERTEFSLTHVIQNGEPFGQKESEQQCIFTAFKSNSPTTTSSISTPHQTQKLGAQGMSHSVTKGELSGKSVVLFYQIEAVTGGHSHTVPNTSEDIVTISKKFPKLTAITIQCEQPAGS